MQQTHLNNDNDDEPSNIQELFPENKHTIDKQFSNPGQKAECKVNSATHQNSLEASNASKSLKFESEDQFLEIESELDFSKDEQMQTQMVQSLDSENLYKDIQIPPIDQNNKGMQKKRKNSRKIRTTITREKLAKMNQIFADYCKNKEEGKCPKENLKEIGVNLQLGYSTILHKFRQYRAHKTVKGGALIASLQKKRKYRKSKQIEAIIEKSLSSGPFYTAVQLSDYIYTVEGKKYSRSIISRHLGQMGYSYKNLKSSPIEKNKPVFKQTRRVYANIIYPFIQDPNVIILFLDQLACSVATFQRKRAGLTHKDIFNENPTDYVSLFIASTSKGIVTHNVKRGFYNQQEFISLLVECLDKLVGSPEEPKQKKVLVVTDMNKIHLDPLGAKQKPIKSQLNKYQAKRFYFPPSSPHLNPIESMFANLKSKLFKKEIQGPIQLQMQIKRCVEDIRKESVDVYFQDMERCLKEVMREEPKCDNSADHNSYSYESTK